MAHTMKKKEKRKGQGMAPKIGCGLICMWIWPGRERRDWAHRMPRSHSPRWFPKIPPSHLSWLPPVVLTIIINLLVFPALSQFLFIFFFFFVFCSVTRRSSSRAVSEQFPSGNQLNSTQSVILVSFSCHFVFFFFVFCSLTWRSSSRAVSEQIQSGNKIEFNSKSELMTM